MATLQYTAEELEEFRQCFFLYARAREVSSFDILATVMCSLRRSPTSDEIKRYLKQYGGRLTFAKFLEVMAEQDRRERVPQDVLQAFEQQDPRRTGRLPTRELRRLLTHWGDRLTNQELEAVFREAQLSSRAEEVNYRDLLRAVQTPLPDYR